MTDKPHGPLIYTIRKGADVIPRRVFYLMVARLDRRGGRPRPRPRPLPAAGLMAADLASLSSQPGNLSFWGPDQRMIMMIRFDTEPVRIEVAEGVAVDDAAKAVLAAMGHFIEQAVEAAATRRMAR